MVNIKISNPQMKLHLLKISLLLSLIFFHCDTNEPTFYKTTIITYLGSGDVVVESIFRNIPNIPTQIMTDGIMTPNYIAVVDANINGIPIDTSKFEFNYKKTEKGNFNYISLKNSYFKSSHDTIYIKYRTNVLTNYQRSLNELRYLFPFKMVEVIPQSTPIVNVNSNLSLRSDTEEFIPQTVLFNDYKIIDSDSSGNVRYERQYKSTDYNLLLFLPFPKFIYQLNNLRNVGQYHHWINLRDLQLVEEGHSVNLKQIDSSKGLIFSLPFKEKIAYPDISLRFSDKNISPYPVDSIGFESLLHSKKLPYNEAYYFIGPTLELYTNKIRYLLNIIFSIPQNEIGTLEIRYKYNSSAILKKLSYFQYEIYVEPQYLPSVKALDKLEITIPDNFSFQDDQISKDLSYSPGEHSLIFNNINKPEILSYPIVLTINKDGLPLFNLIRCLNIIIFIVGGLLLVIMHFRIISFDLKKNLKIVTAVISIIPTLFLAGFSKEENIFELFIYVWGFLPLISIALIFLYNSKRK